MDEIEVGDSEVDDPEPRVLPCDVLNVFVTSDPSSPLVDVV
jgi:hypothetical protein